MKALIASLALAILTACQSTQPGVEVRVVEVIREVPMPCAGEVPERPLPFVKPTGEGLEALAAALAAKLGEFSLPGRYADRAEAYFAACGPSEP
jgi:hypothetical protein